MKYHAAIAVFIVALCSFIFVGSIFNFAGAQMLVTVTPYFDQFFFMPVAMGVEVGPTMTPITPPPLVTFTPYATATSTSTAVATATPTASPTATNTPTATSSSPTPTNTTTPLAPVDTGDIHITEILYNGCQPTFESDEYVEITNFDNRPIQLAGWLIHDEDALHQATLTPYEIQPGEYCRIYTNYLPVDSCESNNPPTGLCGLTFGSGRAIWHNVNGDIATLIDGNGQVISSCSYPGGGNNDDNGATVVCE